MRVISYLTALHPRQGHSVPINVKCKLPTLHYRRIRGDMIETYKIVPGKYDNLAAPMLPSAHS